MTSLARPGLRRAPAPRGTEAARWPVRAVAGLLLATLTGCAGVLPAPFDAGPWGAGPVTPPASVPAAPGRAGPSVGAVDTAAALAKLAALPVKGRAPKTGYSREEFGPAWADVDRNGCDTRNDMLRRDLEVTAYRSGSRDCVVATGVLFDPYTAARIEFVRGNGTSAAVQIDHVVALSDAWQKGAQQLSPERRLAFANDPLNLLAVDGPSNNKKGDGDAATWLPPNNAYRCAYVARQVSVKAGYGLWVTLAERDAMVRVLSACP